MLIVICQFKNVPLGWSYKRQLENSFWASKITENDIANIEEKVFSTPNSLSGVV